MSWLRVQIDLGKIPPDCIETALLDLGAISIHLSNARDRVLDRFDIHNDRDEILGRNNIDNHRDGVLDRNNIDNDRGEIIEPLAGSTPLWASVRLEALFARDDTAIRPEALDESTEGATIGIPIETVILLAIAGAVAPAPMPVVGFRVIEDQDWIASFRQTLRPRQFGERLWICPADAECPDRQAVCVRMEPGLAFGTGEHPSTALCLDWLAHQPLDGKSMLDFGCGSGILAIAALALGAETVTAVDNDPQALHATLQNARRNRSENRLRVSAPESLEPGAKYDFIVANILSRILIELAPSITDHSRSGTRIALSGILASQANAVSEAYAGRFEFEPAKLRGTWAILYGEAI